MFDKLFEGNNLILVVLVVGLLMSNDKMMNIDMNNIPKEVLLVIGAVLLFTLMNRKNQENYGENEELTHLNKVDTNICSSVCCNQQYWPTGIEQKDNRLKGRSYAPTNFMCSGKTGRGCVCTTKEQLEYLTNRGNNAK